MIQSDRADVLLARILRGMRLTPSRCALWAADLPFQIP